MSGKAEPSRDVAVLVVAAGSGLRFGTALPKQYVSLAGVPVLRRTVQRLRAHPRVRTVQVVIQAEHRSLYDEATSGLGLPEPVLGGATRQESVRNGLEGLAKSGAALVLVHDAVRPLIDDGTIDRVLEAAAAGAALAALPVVDTLHKAAATESDGLVDRTGLWRAQTPQGFRLDALLAAHRAQAAQALTDDAAVASAAGMRVTLVEGHPANIKITTQGDLAFAERLLLGALPETRTGMGFDVHRFGPGDRVMLCGVAIPHEQGVEAHSDGDVGLHALTDALLGAIGDGDIGTHFPPSDPQWRGASSDRFLAHAAGLLAAKGGMIANVDVTILCERPKVGPHRAAMVRRMAEILGISADRVSVKATTTERLGFTGRGEGLAAQAIATVRLPQDGAAP